MFNYSMMYNPMMMYGYGMGNMYGGGGNAYINMRNQYGYPYENADYPSAPMISNKRDPHAIVKRNPVRRFLKSIF